MNRIVVLISGRGSNMSAIVNACLQAKLEAEVVAVISNNPEAAGLSFANDAGIQTQVVDHKQFAERSQFDAKLAEVIDSFRPDWIALAGFMRILGTDFVNRYAGKMINIHPSLLPAYPGLDTHARVLEAGDTHHGASVHFVTPELDAGPVIAQSRVKVEPTDTESVLASRVLSTEHNLYVHALQLCVNGNARLLRGECYLGDNDNGVGTIQTAPDGRTQ